jgi:deazaflavin-dependent oxidoreductase (nitroreductase family)
MVAMSDERHARNQLVIEEFRANGGTVTGVFASMPLPLLHHTGAKSGAEYVSPLAYLPDADRWVVFAGNGGRPANPAWYFNLRAKPETVIEVGRDTVPVTARIADGDEREELVRRFSEVSAPFANLQKATDRVIPVVVLERLVG